jgi:hypothetical protein
MSDRRERPSGPVDAWPPARGSAGAASGPPQETIKPDAESDRRAGAVDRRNHASRAALLERFRAEFREMPGLWVTRSEARRLFGVPEDICGRVLDRLVVEGVLVRTADGIYRPPPRISARRG